MFDFGVGFGAQVGPKIDKKWLSKIDRNLSENQILSTSSREGKSEIWEVQLTVVNSQVNSY